VKRGLVVGGATLDVVWPGALVLGVVRRGAVAAPVSPVRGLVVFSVGVVAPGVAVAPEVVVPGTVVPGMVVPGMVVARVVVPGTVAPGVVAPGVVVADVGRVASGAVITVLVMASVVEPEESPASLTRAAASTPRDSAVTTASVRTGAFQVGDAARRVRAAAPQRRHHSCSG
jgi:hypothetical protein